MRVRFTGRDEQGPVDFRADMDQVPAAGDGVYLANRLWRVGERWFSPGDSGLPWDVDGGTEDVTVFVTIPE